MKFVSKDSPRLWNHQVETLTRAYGKKAWGHFLDMGTGKSRVAIDEIINHNWKLTLILCPKTVVSVWPIEFKKYAIAPIQVVALEDPNIDICCTLLENLDYSKPTVIIVNYDRIVPRLKKDYSKFSALGSMLLEAAKAGHIDAVYCDESHRIKAAGSSISKFVYSLGKLVPYRRCLTGTPAADKPLDVFGQFRFLDDSIYGASFKKFVSKYCVTGSDFPEQILGYDTDNKEEFKRLFESISMTVKASEVQDLPEAQHITRLCNLSQSAKNLYDKLEKEFIVYLDSLQLGNESEYIVLDNVLVEMLRLHQITSGLLSYKSMYNDDKLPQEKEVDTSKKEALIEVLEEIGPNEPVVIFYRYKHDLKNIFKAAKKLGRKVCQQNGNKHEWEEFQFKDTYDLIAVNIKSGGAGIDLTRARYHIFYSVGLSNADYRQALKRGHRPGQKNKVIYYHLVVPKTMDERIKKLLDSKGKTVDEILGSNLVKGLIKDYQK